MKFRGISLLLVISLVLLSYNPIQSLFQKDESSISIIQQKQSNQSDNGKTIVLKQDEVHRGDLLLVNHDFPIRKKELKTDIVSLSKHPEIRQNYGLLNQQIRLSSSIAKSFDKMLGAAKKDGVEHFLISSGYRSFEEQHKLYQEKGSKYALPAGHSEHNLGLALDVGSTLKEMNQAPEGTWLLKHSWEYGFILRYPKGKEDITGIEFEPWHFRYVGLPHSAIMYEKNFTLEEYLNYLKKSASISVKVKGKSYTISYHSLQKRLSIKVPRNTLYTISGDNVGGVIVTVLK